MLKKMRARTSARRGIKPARSTKHIKRAMHVGLWSLATALACHAGSAVAQAFPSRPITLVVPFPTGGSTDISTRLLAKEMEKDLGQPVIVENRPGNAGALGIAHVARSKPDGYTLGVSGVGPTMLLNLTGQNNAYDPLKDFAYVAHQVTVDFVYITRPESPLKDIGALLTKAKSGGDLLVVGNSGTNSPSHLASELLASSAGFRISAVPYKGESQLLVDVLGGHVDVGVATVPGASSSIKSGKARALAVAGAKRNFIFPELPTIAEAAVPGYEVSTWQVIVAPTGTPQPVLEKLNASIIKALSDPALKEQYATYGMEATGSSPKEAREFVERETEKWRKTIESLKQGS